jgi:hypothetical protein
VRHEVFSLRLREDFQPVLLTCSHHEPQDSLTTYPGLLVPFTAFVKGDYATIQFYSQQCENKGVSQAVQAR